MVPWHFLCLLLFATFTDWETNTTVFGYTDFSGGASAPAKLHYFTEITDPRGVRAVRTKSDANDRITTDSYDPNGNTLLGSAPAPGVVVGASPTTLGGSYHFENRLVTATNAGGDIISRPGCFFQGLAEIHLRRCGQQRRQWKYSTSKRTG